MNKHPPPPPPTPPPPPHPPRSREDKKMLQADRLYDRQTDVKADSYNYTLKYLAANFL